MPLTSLQELQALLRSGRGSSSAPSFARPPYEDPNQETQFRSWYSTHADRWGLNPDPDDPLHQYDYRAAFEAGVGPSEQHDGHWPSQFKLASHPNRFVDGMDTVTGEPTAKPQTALDELRGLLQSEQKPKPNFYDLPQAKAMKAAGGILPEDVDVERANRELRETDPILRTSEGAWKGFNKAPGVAFTRNALSVTAGLAGGAVRMVNEVGKQAAPVLWPGQKMDPTQPDKIASVSQVLSAAAHNLQPEQDRAPWMQRLMTDPVRFIVTTTGQSAPYMLGAAVPGLLPATTVGMMGQEEERLAAEGAKPGLGRLGAAAASGGAQALMERIPMARALQGFAGGAGKRALRGAAWEVPMEMAQVLPATLADLSLGLREGESWGDILSKTGSEMLEAGVSAIAPSLLLGMGSPNQLHEPQSLLERTMDWFARKKAVTDLRNLPGEQAAADQARTERRRLASEAAQQAGISAQEAEEIIAPEVEEQEREYTDDEMLAYLDEQVAEQQTPPEAERSWWKGGPTTEIPAPKTPFRVNYGTRTEPEPEQLEQIEQLIEAGVDPETAVEAVSKKEAGTRPSDQPDGTREKALWHAIMSGYENEITTQAENKQEIDEGAAQDGAWANADIYAETYNGPGERPTVQEMRDAMRAEWDYAPPKHEPVAGLEELDRHYEERKARESVVPVSGLGPALGRSSASRAAQQGARTRLSNKQREEQLRKQWQGPKAAPVPGTTVAPAAPAAAPAPLTFGKPRSPTPGARRGSSAVIVDVSQRTLAGDEITIAATKGTKASEPGWDVIVSKKEGGMQTVHSQQTLRDAKAAVTSMLGNEQRYAPKEEPAAPAAPVAQPAEPTSGLAVGDRIRLGRKSDMEVYEVVQVGDGQAMVQTVSAGAPLSTFKIPLGRKDIRLAEPRAAAAPAAPVAQPAPAVAVSPSETEPAVPSPNMPTYVDKSERRTWWRDADRSKVEIGKPQTRRTKRGENGTDIRVEVPVTAPDGTRYVVTAHNDQDQFKFHQPPKKGDAEWRVERHATQPDGTVQREVVVDMLSQREAIGFIVREGSAGQQLPSSQPAKDQARAAEVTRERIRNVKARAAGKPGEAGFMRNPLPRISREAWAKWTRLWRPRKGLSRAMSGVERRWIARQAALKMQIEEGFKELTRAIEGHDYSQGGLKKSVPTTDKKTGVERVPVHPHQQLVRLLDDAFRGLVAVRGRYSESGQYIPSTLEKHAPETVAIMERLIAMRDTFQRDLRKRQHEGGSGIGADISLELERQYGLYVHRTYQAKFDKGWQEKLEAENPVAYKAGLEAWVRQALAPAIQKLQELNPDLSYDAARTQVMTAWTGRWQQQKIDPTTRRIKLPMVGKGPLDPATILLGAPVFTADGRKGTIEFFDPAAPDTATLQVQTLEFTMNLDGQPSGMRFPDQQAADTYAAWARSTGRIVENIHGVPGSTTITEDHPVADLRQAVRSSIVVDNPSQVEGSYLAALRWSNRGGSMLPGAAVEAGRNLNVRRERDRQKPDWERALLGEVRDVRTNFLGTMAQMVHLAETDRFLHEIAEIGKAEGVFFPQPEGDATERVDPDLFGLGKVEGLEQAKIAEEILAGNPDLAPEVVAQLQAIQNSVKGGPAYHPRTSPLGQLFTTPEIAIALRNEVKGPQVLGVRLAYGLASMAKANQTVYSIQSANRNYISNMFYLMANGWNPVSIFGIADRIGKGANARKIAYSRVVNDLYNLGQDAHLIDRATNDPHHVEKWLTDKLAEYIRLGIAHQSTTVGDLHRLARVAYDMKRNEDRPGKRKHLEQTAQDMYVAHDDYAKILAYERELATMKEAYPDLPSLGMQPHQVAQAMQDLEREGALKQWRGAMMQGARQHYGEQMLLHRNLSEQAASKVRRTMQNYQELPELYQWLSGNPITAPFTAFRFSLVRNAKNILQLGWEEALSQNQVIKKRGIQRLVGAGATALFPMAWGRFLQWKSDTDDDEVDALRIIGYPWSANASLGIWSNKDGVITYFDGGHLDVWDDLREPFLASMRHGGWDDKFIRVGYALATNYLPFDEEIALGAALDLKRNRKKSGGDIWKSTDNALTKTLKGTMHLGKTAAFPGTLRSMQKLYYAAAGKDDPGGRDYQLMQEIIALGGPRFVTLNLKQRLDDHAKAYNHALRDAGDNLRVYRAEDVADGYQKAIDGTQHTVDDFLEQVRAYRTLGLTEDEIYTVLRGASIRPAIAMTLAQLDRQTALLLLNNDLEVRQYKKQAELEGGY